jgi:hypothetical protein
VAQDHHQRYSKLGDGVFHRAFDGGSGTAHVIACNPDDEEIAHPLVEKDLRRNAGIGTPEDGSDRFLPLGKRPEVFRRATRVRQGSRDKVPVSFDKAFQNGIGMAVRRCVQLGSGRKFGEDRGNDGSPG